MTSARKAVTIALKTKLASTRSEVGLASAKTVTRGLRSVEVVGRSARSHVRTATAPNRIFAIAFTGFTGARAASPALAIRTVVAMSSMGK